MSRFQRWLLGMVVPEDRLEDVKADMEDGFRERFEKNGATKARRYLRREIRGLVLWRLQWWRSARAARDAAETAAANSSGLGRDVRQDLGYGLRTLLRRPAFSLTAIGVLGLGIGAPATVLTLVNTIFFRPPEQIIEPDRLLRLTRGFGNGRGGGAIGNPDFLYYRDNVSTLSGLAAYGEFRAVAFSTDGSQADQLDVLFVSDNLFDVLGVVPVLGRSFRPEENQEPGTHPVTVLNHDFWVRALGADPNIIGKTVYLGGSPYEVVGVAPKGFGSVSPVGTPPDAWVPIAMYGALTRAPGMDWWQRVPTSRSRWLVGIGRLAPGVTYEAAAANLVALGEAMEYDGKSEGEGAWPQKQFLYSPSLQKSLSDLSRMLLVVVALVFLVATFNAAVLLLSRATTRRRELSIRTALGAGRGRIVRQILVETSLLGLAGGLVGLGLAFGLSDVAASLLPVRFATEFTPDLPVILAAIGLSLTTAIAVGLLPALRVTRKDLRPSLHDRGDGIESHHLQNALVVGQVGLSMILLAGAVLFGRSFWSARGLDLGFATENQLIVEVPLTELDFSGEEVVMFTRSAVEDLEMLPGVQGVSVTRMVPFQGDWTSDFSAPPGAEPNAEDELIRTGMNAVGPDYFRLSGIPILSGRAFTKDDAGDAPLVAVINETLADQIWPGQNPIGKTLPYRDEMDVEIVGLARNSTYYELGEDPQTQTYLSLAQFPPRVPRFLIQTAGPATEMISEVQRTLRELEPGLVFRWVTSLEAVVEEETNRYEVSAVLVAVFSAIALLMAAAGLYGTISFLVARRTREIGVRMALGADRRAVAREILRFGLKLTVAGMILGLSGSIVLRRYAEGLLFQVEAGDPIPLLLACLVLVAVAALAAFVPTRQATRVDPMEAMRAD